ncbi:MAG: glycosyltransferase [Christensenella sp.]|nr:glycosyltransferase [Christensenella sp.]
MKKILHCVNSMNMGGIETLLMNIFRNIDRKEYQFDFACVEREKAVYDDEIFSLGGKIKYMPPFRYKNPFKIFADLSARKKFFKNNNEYDVCHIHSSNAFNAYYRAKYAIQAGIKTVIVHSHNSSGINRKLNSFYQKRLSKLNIVRLACSQQAGEWMFGAKEFQIINNAIDLDKFYYNPSVREKIRAEHNWQNMFIVGHIGRFNIQKNHKFLIEVFAKVAHDCDDAILVLIGKGELEAEIKEQVSNYGMQDKVFFLGIKQNANEYLQAMDVFAFPSLYEGLGIAYIEAQASGAKTLISNTIPFVPITDNLNSLSIQNVDQWVDEIKSEHGKERKEALFCDLKNEYDIHKTIEKLCKIYNQSV